MNREQKLIGAFNQNDQGFAEVPQKKSGVFISRLFNGDASGCAHCFPHGYETINCHQKNYQRSWKRYRKHQWKT
ncbi:phosphate ABC transporter substrate-binding protein [Pseudoalteromonas phenolica]|uniref:phosphate ABC transporter substrate-binding protein n=1 Tax=Pseudoalteromonas phenolica TaxID=161398 RepID=UPI00110A224B|nr:phosphate ABC transporter substrate-binding protein [Pseudoalteromonas phenolica]TMO53454.1 phosphate ABC transporter substrate-binding protein [Pseudoalteromonas phenolica]